MKICSKCKVKKPGGEFYIDSRAKDGLCWCCKDCRKVYGRKYYNKNREHLILKASIVKHTDEYMQEYRERNKLKLRLYKRKYDTKRKSKNMQFRLSCALRSRLNKAIKNNQKSGSVIGDLGCSIEELKRWLEQQFRPGMGWKNYGKWHIDHIKPLSSFDLINKKQLKKACHWFNLRPLWAKENLSKGDKK